MTDGADTAYARGDSRHFVERPAFGELLETAYLRHLELRIGNIAGVVQLDGDLGVAFDAAHRLDRNALHRRSYPNLILVLFSVLRPSSRFVNNAEITLVCGGHPGTLTSTFTKSCAGRASFKSCGKPSPGMHLLTS